MQKTGEETRDRWHKTDWAKVAKDPESISFRREDWIHQHDAEKVAEDTFDEAFKKVTGKLDAPEPAVLPTASTAVVV